MSAEIESSREFDVAVIGLWHLGTVSAAAWTSTGRSVIAWDGDPACRESVTSGRGPVAEPGVDEALSAAFASGRLEVVDDPAVAMAEAVVTHLAYDTGVSGAGRHDDPRLDEAVGVFSESAPNHALLLASSQLPVGTCSGWRDRLAQENRGLLLAHAPENLRLGRALDDFLHPQRLLIGADDEEAFERTARLLASFSDAPLRMSLTAAELAKHATNSYLALCVAFANELAWLSLAVGADPIEVSEALRADARVAPSAPLRPGAAFSGATLLRDVVMLRDLGLECGRPELFDAIIDVNARQSDIALDWLAQELETIDGARIAVAGLTYKPGTSTLRDSLPLRVVSKLAAQGAAVAAWDPIAEPFEPTNGVTRTETLDEAVEGAAAVLVLTPHPELRELAWADLRPARRLVVDGCLGVDRRAAEAAGWVYRGFAGV